MYMYMKSTQYHQIEKQIHKYAVYRFDAKPQLNKESFEFTNIPAFIDGICELVKEKIDPECHIEILR